jgi:hypothetical protein
VVASVASIVSTSTFHLVLALTANQYVVVWKSRIFVVRCFVVELKRREEMIYAVNCRGIMFYLFLRMHGNNNIYDSMIMMMMFKQRCSS